MINGLNQPIHLRLYFYLHFYLRAIDALSPGGHTVPDGADFLQRFIQCLWDIVPQVYIQQQINWRRHNDAKQHRKQQK